MKNSLSPTGLVARSAATMGALAAYLLTSPTTFALPAA